MARKMTVAEQSIYPEGYPDDFAADLDSDTGRTLIGRCNRGHSYWLDADGYVYQLLDSGHWNGWLCRATIWETFRQNMVTSRPAE